MQRPLLSPETFFAEEPLFANDGLLNEKGLAHNTALLSKKFEGLNKLFEKHREEQTQENIVVPQVVSVTQ
ncbi:MAG: hypothetical protein HY064_04635 [Bacteroidetes bacterium]|nr:hypothetical protein [Bacteroidota bacterium]